MELSFTELEAIALGSYVGKKARTSDIGIKG
jgi:hypothetical protein